MQKFIVNSLIHLYRVISSHFCLLFVFSLVKSLPIFFNWTEWLCKFNVTITQSGELSSVESSYLSTIHAFFGPLFVFTKVVQTKNAFRSTLFSYKNYNCSLLEFIQVSKFLLTFIRLSHVNSISLKMGALILLSGCCTLLLILGNSGLNQDNIP